MAFLISALLPLLVATTLSIACTVIWRIQLVRPMVYCVVAFFLVLGVHYLVQAVVELAKYLWPIGEGYFLVARPTSAAEIEAIERQMTIEGLAIAIAVVFFSYPLLTLLKSGGATYPARAWTFSQHFSWRASTLLLTYVAVFWVLGTLQPSLPNAVSLPIRWVQETLGPGALIVWCPSAIFSLAFFIASIWKRNPQVQFLVELVVAILIVLSTPTY